MSGLAGELLYLDFIRKVKNSKKTDSLFVKKFEFLLQSFENEDFKNISFSSGIAGVLWMIKKIDKNGELIDPTSLHALDKFIFDNLSTLKDHNNWDPLHGLVGIGQYFISDENGDFYHSANNSILDHLKHLIERPNNTSSLTWAVRKEITEFEYPTLIYDFGIAHGNAGVILYLLNLYKKGFQKGVVKNLVLEAIEFIESYKTTDAKNLCMYPLTLVEGSIGADKFDGKIAWCYGDLCIALIYLKSGIAFGREDFIQRSHNIILHNLKRSLSQAGVTSNYHIPIIDGTFCHGTAGIAYFYKLFSSYFKDQSIHSEYKRWLELTIRLCERHLQKNRLSVPYYSNETFHKGILNGISGIGLVLASELEESDHYWPECFLLN